MASLREILGGDGPRSSSVGVPMGQGGSMAPLPGGSTGAKPTTPTGAGISTPFGHLKSILTPQPTAPPAQEQAASSPVLLPSPPKPAYPGTTLQARLGVTPEQAELHQKKSQMKHQLSQNMQRASLADRLYQGFQSGGYGLKETYYGLEALRATIAEDKQALEDAGSALVRIQEQKAPLGVSTKVEDFFTRKADFGDFLEWAAFNLGEQIPNMATVITGGGLGGFAGKQVAKLVARKTIDDITARQLTKQFVERGAKAGAFLFASGLETSGTAQEQLAATGQINPIVAIGAGTVKGALEIATPAVIAQRFGFGESLANKFYSKIIDKMTKGGLVRRTAGGILTVGAGEGVTEGLQETVDIAARDFVDENYDALGPDARSRVLNSVALGFLVGGAPGAVTGAFGTRERPLREATAREIEDKLREPTPEFQAPGGFIHTAEVPTGEKSTDFVGSFQAETTRRKKGEKTYQIDMSQVPVGAVSARLESLPSRDELIAEGVQIIPELSDALDKKNRALRREFGTKDALRGERVKSQQQADALMQQARESYEKALAAGFRYMPKEGVEQLRREGFTLAPGTVLPTSAYREVKTTGLRLDPSDILSVGVEQFSGVGDYSAPVNVSVGQGVRMKDTRGFIFRSELAEHQLSTDVRSLPLTTTTDTTRFIFDPSVREEDKAGLITEFEQLRNIFDKDQRATAYDSLLNKGLRYKPVKDPNRSAIVVGIRPSQIHSVPGQLGSTEKMVRFWDYLDYFDSHKKDVFDTYKDDFVGTMHDLDKHKAGTVEVVGAADALPQYQDIIKKGEAILQHLTKKMLPNAKLIFDVREIRNGSYKGAFAQRVGKDVSVIYINSQYMKSERLFAQVLFHEFGHVLSSHILSKASQKVKSAIFSAFLRHLHAQRRQSGTEFFLNFSASMRVHELGTPYLGGTGAEAAVDPVFLDWYNFDEWFAENTAKWLEVPGTSANTIAEKFFKGLAEKIREVWEIIRKKFPGWGPDLNETMRTFLEDVYNGRFEEEETVVETTYLAETQQNSDLPYQPSYGSTITGLTAQRRADVDKWAWYMRWGWNVLQIAAKNPHIAGLQAFVERLRSWHIEKMAWISRAEERSVAWRNLGKEMGQRLGDFIWELETMPYLLPGEKPRQPTMAELVALAQKHKLNKDALDLFIEVRKDFNLVLKEMEEVWIADAVASITDQVELGKAVLQIKKEIASLRMKPYFPHARFGDFTVSVRDANGKLLWYRQFEDELAQKKGAKAAELEFPGGDVRMAKLPEDMKHFRGMPSSLMDSIAKKLNLSTVQLRILEELKFDMSPANSWAKHMKKRKGTPGFSTDARRAYSDYFFHAANSLARLKHRAGLENSIKDVIDSGLGMPDGNKRIDIANYMSRLLEYVMNPPNEWTAVRSIAFSWYLGFAIDSAIVNLTQVPMVAAPYLSSHFGDGAAIGQLTRAYKDFWRSYNVQGAAARVPRDEVDALALAIQHGLVDQSYASELAAAAHGGVMGRFVAGRPIERTIGKIGRAGAWFFHTAEKLNRRVVFGAAYRLGRDARDAKSRAYIQKLMNANTELVHDLGLLGWTPEQIGGYLAGRDVIERTMFEYSQWARPEFMRGKKASLFTFFSFMQNMLWFARYSPGNKRYLAMLVAFAGVMGLPLAEDLNDIIKMFTTKVLGKLFDPAVELRKIIAELDMNPDLIMHGFGQESLGMTALGEMLGIPIPGFDVSRRIGMGKIIPGIEPFTMQGASWEDRMARTTEEVIGASYAIPVNLVQAIATFNPDDFKSYERLFPRFLKNLTRGTRWYLEGEEQTGSGATLRRFDPEDPKSLVEVLGGALGLVPTGLMQKWDQAGAVREAEAYWTAQRGLLFTSFWKAARARDREAIADTKAAIKRFNESAPRGLRITGDALRQSMESRQKARLKTEAGLPRSKGMTNVVREVNRAFPAQR